MIDGKVSEAALERVAEETHKMGLSERIHHYDRLQARKWWADGNGAPLPLTMTADELEKVTGRQVIRHPEVMVCRNNPDHGALVIRGDGSTMICGGRAPGAFCTFNQPVSV